MTVKELVERALICSGAEWYSAGQIHQAIVGALEGKSRITRYSVKKELLSRSDVEIKWTTMVRNKRTVQGRVYRMQQPVRMMKELELKLYQ